MRFTTHYFILATFEPCLWKCSAFVPYDLVRDKYVFEGLGGLKIQNVNTLPKHFFSWLLGLSLISLDGSGKTRLQRIKLYKADYRSHKNLKTKRLVFVYFKTGFGLDIIGREFVITKCSKIVNKSKNKIHFALTRAIAS